MVKVVDHDEKRDEISACAAKLIAEGGLEALTTRRLAKEVGCSLGIISYYFDNKAAMVRAALDWSNRGILSQLNQFDENDIHNIDQYKAMLNAFLPLNEQSDLEWRIRLNLITFSLTDDALMEEQRQRREGAYELSKVYISQLHEAGVIKQQADIDTVSQNSVNLVFGLATHLMMIPLAEREAALSGLNQYIDSNCNIR